MGEQKQQVKKMGKRSKAAAAGSGVRGSQPQVAKARSTPKARRNSESRSEELRQDVKVTADNKEVFAKGLGFKKLFFVFLIGSVIGTIYEDILIYIIQGVWILHRGVIYGPFNIVYGFGAVAMCLVLLRKKYTWWEVFGLSAILGGVLEYILSLGQEIITGTTSWDYSHQFLNIHGRTTIPLMLVWGFLGLLLVKAIYPFCSKAIEKIPPRIGNPLFWILLVFMIFDCLISWSAVVRQTLRHNGYPPLTPVGEFYDNYYTDEFLKRYYANMERKDERD